MSAQRHSHDSHTEETLGGTLLRVGAVLLAILLGALLAPAGMGLLGAILAAVTVFIATQGAQVESRLTRRARRRGSQFSY